MKILMPLPDKDFDPSEAGVSFALLSDAGHSFTCATPSGNASSADARMLTGEGLGIWKSTLRADGNALHAYSRLAASDAFKQPIRHDAMNVDDHQALLLPGGHAPLMKSYLESVPLQQTAAAFFAAGKPVGAICHGVVVLARSKDVSTGKSVLHGKKTTALVSWMELSAWVLTALWLGSYYRTYPQTVEAEVKSALASPSDFLRGPYSSARDAPGALQRGFTVLDGKYLSARWPGDAHKFATEFAALLQR